MAFVNPIDPATPTDANDLAAGDDRIREIKAALNERLPQVIDGWPNTDPLKLVQSAVRAQQGPPVSVGTALARPSPPAALGLLYYAHDTDELFVAKQGATALEWDLIRQGIDQAPPVQVGTLAGRPSPPAKVGLLYYATDSGDLYISLAGSPDNTWLNLTPDPAAAAIVPAAGFVSDLDKASTDTTRHTTYEVARILYLDVARKPVYAAEDLDIKGNYGAEYDLDYLLSVTVGPAREEGGSARQVLAAGVTTGDLLQIFTMGTTIKIYFSITLVFATIPVTRPRLTPAQGTMG